MVYIYLETSYQTYQHRLLIDEALIQAKADLDVKINASMPDMEKLKIIHDYILNRAEYAYEDDGITPKDIYWAQNIEGILLEGQAVGEGYAKLFNILLDHFDIYNLLLTGKSNHHPHMWNLVYMDEAFYHFDITWNDVDEGIVYDYFGLSHTKILTTHQLYNHNTNDRSIYLYDLPEILDLEVNLIRLYENNTLVGIYPSIKVALSHMEDSTADYILKLYDYDNSNARVELQYIRTYQMPKGTLPLVNSLTIKGDSSGLANQNLTRIGIYFDDIILSSDLILENIRVFAAHYKEESIIDIDTHSLKLKGDYAFIVRNVRLIGGENSRLINHVQHATSYADMDLDILEIHRRLTARGQTNKVHTLKYMDFSSLVFFGDIIELIEIANIESFHEGIMSPLQLNFLANPTINIGNMSHDYKEDFRYQFLVRPRDLENIPIINITGDIDAGLEYHFFTQTYTSSIDLDGREVFRQILSVNLGEYLDNPLMYAPNVDENRLKVRLNNRYITPLYNLDDSGYLYRSHDIIEIIEDGVLKKVVSLNENIDHTYEVPDNVHTIGRDAFFGFFNLHTIIIHDTVHTIESFGLAGLNNVFVYLPSSVETVEQYGFGQNWFTILTDLKEFPSNWDIDTKEAIPAFVWDYKETLQNEDYIYAVTNNDTVAILENLQAIDTEIINVPAKIDGMPVTNISNIAFSNNSNLREIYLPTTLKRIEYGMLRNASNLHTIHLPEEGSLKTIGANAFSQVRQLEEITIPASVKYVGRHIFFNHPNLTIYIQSSEYIDDWHEHWNHHNHEVIYLDE